MKARHICAVLGVAAAVGAVVFARSLAATNDRQSSAVAERLLAAVPVPDGAQVARFALDFRPEGRVMQGPPLVACVATSPDVKGAVVTKALFAQRRLKPPSVGTELVFVGRRGAYRVPLTGVIDWERPARGYPNVFVSLETAAKIGEEWNAWEPKDAAALAPAFMSDTGRHMDRAKPLLLWAAALTALCLLVNSLLLSIEARRRETAILRMVGMTRRGVAMRVVAESLAMAAAGAALGVAAGTAALAVFVSADAATFPMGMAVDASGIVVTALLTPVAAAVAALFALRPALGVKPLEAASSRSPRRRPIGMLVAFASGFGAFVAVEVWGASLTKPFIPSPEWPDAVVSILPGGVSAFDVDRLKSVCGVRRIAELQPLQVWIKEEGRRKKEEGGGREKEEGRRKKEEGGRKEMEEGRRKKEEGGRKEMEEGRRKKEEGGRKEMEEGRRKKEEGGRKEMEEGGKGNVLLLASDWLPEFKFVDGERAEAEKAVREGDACVVTEMMARARKLHVGDSLPLDCGGGLHMKLKVAGIVDLNWHMVTSRGLLRGLNRMPVNTDGPVFVSFDTLQACDARPAEFVNMTHLWLDYEPQFLAEHGVFEAGRIVEHGIVEALDGAYCEDGEGEVRGNTVRLHSRDEVSDGTLAHGAQLVGAMARIPYMFLAVVSLGFIAALVASADSRRREFSAMRAVGATRAQVAGELVREALRTAVGGVLLGTAGGTAVGWLCTAGTRAAMANWGLPACFAMPVVTIALGAIGAIAFAIAVAVPTAIATQKSRL